MIGLRRRESRGTWTPVLTAATPNSLSVSYTTQSGWFRCTGDEARIWWDILTSAFTHTTASGNLRITGSPFTAANDTGYFALGPGFWGGLTLPANYTDVDAYMDANSNIIKLARSGSTVAAADVAITEAPTGGTVRLVGSMVLRRA